MDKGKLNLKLNKMEDSREVDESKMSIRLEPAAKQYFDKIAACLEYDNNGGTQESQVMNYILETMNEVEEAFGDPAAFVENVKTGKIMVIQKPEKAKVSTKTNIDEDKT